MAAPKNNKYAVGNKGGRPPKYSDPKKLEKKIIEYFDWIEGEKEEVEVVHEDEEGNEEKFKTERWIRHPEPATLTGLALFLGFADKQSLYDYAQKEEFLHPIKRALTVVEKEYELRLESKYSTGAIFALKNFGWKDKNQHELTGKYGETLNMPLKVIFEDFSDKDDD